jgi:hypothetical protein
VRYVLDPKSPLPLTDAQRRELAALAGLADERVDVSDIPPLAADFFAKALRNPFLYPPVRVSADVVEWFMEQAENSGEMTIAINRVLLAHIAAEKKKRSKKTA